MQEGKQEVSTTYGVLRLSFWLGMTQRSPKQYRLFSVLLVDRQNLMVLCSLVLSLLLFHPLFSLFCMAWAWWLRACCWRYYTIHMVKEYRKIKLVLTANLSPCWLALIALEDAICAGVGVKCYPHSMKPMNYNNYQHGKIYHNSNRSTHIMG